MKAILVVDVYDNAKINEAIADIVFRDIDMCSPIVIGISKWYNGVRLKPMPQKMEIDKKVYIDYDAMNKGYQCGFNACIDEILGG